MSDSDSLLQWQPDSGEDGSAPSPSLHPHPTLPSEGITTLNSTPLKSEALDSNSVQPDPDPLDPAMSADLLSTKVVDTLVADLEREQRRMQDLFGALAFALRSFKNLNQVLELIAFVASHLTDAEGGVLVLFHPNGTIQLEQLHCANPQQAERIRVLLEQVTHSLSTQSGWMWHPNSLQSKPDRNESPASQPSPGSQTPNRTLPQPQASEATPGPHLKALQDLKGSLQDIKAVRWSDQPLSYESTTQIEQILDECFQEQLGSEIQLFGTPLLIRNTVRGRLYVFSSDSSYAWDENRQQLLRVIADQAAVAIENDQLTAELRRKAALAKELEIGSEIQAQLLPRQYPEIPGIALAACCRAANMVSGDYYDFIKVPFAPQLELDDCGCDDSSPSSDRSQPCWGIVIGDVMGKGVPAGLLMTMTRGILRAEILNHHRPARILHHLNQVMFNDLDNSNRFISLYYSEYDPNTGRLCYSNAAHNPTLWWQAKTGELRSLDTAGALLGLDLNSHYEEGCITLQPGDVIVYYTDGFTEAANAEGNRLEVSGFEAAIQHAAQTYEDPQGIVNSLFEQVEAFRQNPQARQRARRSRAKPPYLGDLDPQLDDPSILLQQETWRERDPSVDDMTLVVLKVLPIPSAS